MIESVACRNTSVSSTQAHATVIPVRCGSGAQLVCSSIYNQQVKPRERVYLLLSDKSFYAISAPEMSQRAQAEWRTLSKNSPGGTRPV